MYNINYTLQKKIWGFINHPRGMSKGYEYIVPTATVVLPILLALPVQYSLPSHYRCYSYYQPQPPPTWSKAWLIAQWRLQIPDWTCSISFCSGSLPVCIGLFQRGHAPTTGSGCRISTFNDSLPGSRHSRCRRRRRCWSHRRWHGSHRHWKNWSHLATCTSVRHVIRPSKSLRNFVSTYKRETNSFLHSFLPFIHSFIPSFLHSGRYLQRLNRTQSLVHTLEAPANASSLTPQSLKVAQYMVWRFSIKPLELQVFTFQEDISQHVHLGMCLTVLCTFIRSTGQWRKAPLVALALDSVPDALPTAS